MSDGAASPRRSHAARCAREETGLSNWSRTRPTQAAMIPSASLPVLFEGYSRALVRHTAAVLLNDYARRMRGLHLDPQAVAYLEAEAQATVQQCVDQGGGFLPTTVPVLFEGYSQVLLLHTAAFLLRHYTITMHGLRLDPEAVAYLEEEAQVVEQQMDDQDAAFPDLLDTTVLEVMGTVVAAGGHGARPVGLTSHRSRRPSSSADPDHGGEEVVRSYAEPPAAPVAGNLPGGREESRPHRDDTGRARVP